MFWVNGTVGNLYTACVNWSLNGKETEEGLAAVDQLVPMSLSLGLAFYMKACWSLFLIVGMESL